MKNRTISFIVLFLTENLEIKKKNPFVDAYYSYSYNLLNSYNIQHFLGQLTLTVRKKIRTVKVNGKNFQTVKVN